MTPMATICFDMYGTLCSTGGVVDTLASELQISEAWSRNWTPRGGRNSSSTPSYTR